MNKRIRKKRIRYMLLAELSLQFEQPEDAVQWLETPLATLENRTPREAIASGEEARVTMLLDGMNAATADRP